MAASTQSPRPVQDGLSIRPTRVELRSNEVAGDIRKVMSHPLPGLPMYKHLVPRVPAGIKDRWAVLIFCCSPRLSYTKSLFFFSFLLSSVLRSMGVEAVMAATATREGVPMEVIHKRASDMLEQMGHTMATNILRFSAYVVHKALVQIYEQVAMRNSQCKEQSRHTVLWGVGWAGGHGKRNRMN